MAKPTVPVNSLDWATNNNYTGGPDIGTPTKDEPAAGRKDDGWRKSDKPPAQEWNWVWHWAIKWLIFLYDEMLSPLITDAGVLKTDTVDTAQIVDDSVTGAKLAPAVAGIALVQDGSGNLDVSHNTTLAILSGKLAVANSGVNAQQIAPDAVNTSKIASEAVGRAEMLEFSNLVWNPTARLGNAGYYDGGLATDYDTPLTDTDQYTAFGAPNFTAENWTGPTAVGPRWSITPTGAAFKADLSEKIPISTVNVTLSAILVANNLSAGTVGIDVVCYDITNVFLGIICSIDLTSDQARAMFEANEIPPANTTYVRIRKRHDAAAVADSFIVERIQLNGGTRAEAYDDAMGRQYLSARYSRDSAQTVIDGNTDVFDFDDITFDDPGTNRVTTGASWNFEAERYMKIEVTAHIQSQVTTDEWDVGEFIALLLYKTPNGGGAGPYSLLDIKLAEASVVGGFTIMLSGTDGIELNEGDKIDIRLENQTGANISSTASGTNNYVFIREI